MTTTGFSINSNPPAPDKLLRMANTLPPEILQAAKRAAVYKAQER